MKPFLICALPRSRTAWLANFLTVGSVTCFHELTALVPTFVDFKCRLLETGSAYAGNSDSAQVLWIERILTELMVLVPVVIIERNPVDVLKSMQGCGLGQYAEETIAMALPKLDWLKREFDPLILSFDDLDSIESMRKLWTYCISPNMPFPSDRWYALRDKQVQVHPQKMFDSWKDKFGNIELLLKEARAA